MHGNCKDLTGQKFGRLTIISSTNKRSGRHVIWKCKCGCGNECLISSSSLQNNLSRSCGCLQRELIAKQSTTHGMSDTQIYNIWKRMLQRCENPNYREFKYWGGRGIKVCERWHSFENFYEDVGNSPEGLTLDRWPDNDGNYEPNNFRWATHKEQANNKRDSKRQLWFFAFNLNTGEWDEDNNQCVLARRWGLDQTKISLCLLGKQKIHKGWIFQRI